MPKLPRSFYTRSDVVQISKELLGKYLYTHIDGQVTAGIIVETEAYRGRGDRACHANNNKRTTRTEIMFHQGGLAYVYLCYGIHHLFNVVTNQEGMADAVLIRAIEPIDGMSQMLERRKMKDLKTSITSGPGSLAAALGITGANYGTDLRANEIWICDESEKGVPSIEYSDDKMIASPRVGVAYAQEDALFPWRFRIKNNKWVSPAK